MRGVVFRFLLDMGGVGNNMVLVRGRVDLVGCIMTADFWEVLCFCGVFCAAMEPMFRRGDRWRVSDDGVSAVVLYGLLDCV